MTEPASATGPSDPSSKPNAGPFQQLPEPAPVAAKATSGTKSRSARSAFWSALVGGLVVLSTTSVSEYLKIRSLEATEKMRLKYEVLKDVWKSPTKGEAAERLDFYLKAGILTDKDGVIQGYADNPSSIPDQLIEDRVRRLEEIFFIKGCMDGNGRWSEDAGGCIYPDGHVEPLNSHIALPR